MVDEDKALRDLQAQWGMTALAISHRIVHLEAAVLDALHHADADPSFARVVLLSLKDEINNCVAASPVTAFIAS